MNGTKTVFFIGKPGCGKGTQAKMLSEKSGWPVLSAGNQFRAIAAEDTPVGRKVKGEMEAGILAPHWFAMYLYLKSLFSVGEGAPVIFDGFNRKMAEAELVVESLTWLERSLTIININVSDEVVRERIRGRKVIEGRADDNAVEERLKEFYANTEPAIELFRDAGVLIDIDGERTPEEIAADVNSALGL